MISQSFPNTLSEKQNIPVEKINAFLRVVLDLMKKIF